MKIFKFTASVLLLLFLLQACASFQNKTTNTFTDAKEWGFRGKIKTVTTFVYNNLSKKDGHWQISDEGILSVSKMEFDSHGNLIKIVDSSLTDRYKKYNTVIVYEYEKGVKTGYKKFDRNTNQMLEQGTYEWITPYYYKLHVTIGEGYNRVEAYSKLNENFREIEAGHTVYFFQEKMESMRYFNILDKEGFLVRCEYIDDLFNHKFTIIPEDVEYDKFNNLIKLAEVYKESGTLKFFRVRQLEYYP